MSFPGESLAKPHEGHRPAGPPAKSTRVWLLTAAAAVTVATVSVVAWLVIPHKPNHTQAGQTVTGEVVKQVLLDGTELATMLGQSFKSTTRSPIYGGFEEMEHPPTPGECAGVMNVAPQQVYSSANVQSYARQTWADATHGGTSFDRPSTRVMFVEESVVALPSAEAAQTLTAKFAEQWKRCDGHAVNQPAGTSGANEPQLPGTEIHISDVRVSDTLLNAAIALDGKPQAPDVRVVGVQGNCIVGVLIAFTGAENGIGSGDPKTSGIELVQAMMNKVATLSDR